MECCCGKKKTDRPYEGIYPLDTGYIYETPDNLGKSIVEEMTPDGRVRMRLLDGIFEYWAERAQPYRYLETVARKYVIVYDCREVYVKMFRELLKSRDVEKVEMSSVYLKRGPPRASIANSAANRYRWMGKYVETIAPRGMSYSEFKKSI